MSHSSPLAPQLANLTVAELPIPATVYGCVSHSVGVRVGHPCCGGVGLGGVRGDRSVGAGRATHFTGSLQLREAGTESLGKSKWL